MEWQTSAVAQPQWGAIHVLVEWLITLRYPEPRNYSGNEFKMAANWESLTDLLYISDGGEAPPTQSK